MRALGETLDGSGEEHPLAGRSVLVTRPTRQADDLSERLRALGAEVVEVPTIRIEDPPDPGPLRDAAASLASYDWLVVTSVNGVRKLSSAMAAVDASPSAAPRLWTAAIGPATAARLIEAGFPPPLVPERYRAETLLETILAATDRTLVGRRVLLPRAARARDVLPEGLEAAGAEVHQVVAYVTRAAEERAADLRRRLDDGVDWITFTASSTVRSFRDLVGASTAGARVAAIGPITAATVRELGMPIDVVAEEHTIAGLVRALVAAQSPPEPTGGGS